jgi:hypothetical protein
MVRFPAEAWNFSRHLFQTGSGAHPASYTTGTGGSLQGVNRSGREADHSPPFCAKVNNAWSYTSTPPYIMAWCLVKYSIRLHDMALKVRDFTHTSTSGRPEHASRTDILRTSMCSLHARYGEGKGKNPNDRTKKKKKTQRKLTRCKLRKMYAVYINHLFTITNTTFEVK